MVLFWRHYHFKRCHVRQAVQVGSKTHCFGLKLGVFLKAPSPLKRGSSPPNPVSPDTHPPTYRPRLRHTHRKHRQYQRSTHDCDLGAPPVARIPMTRAPFFPKKKKKIGKNLWAAGISQISWGVLLFEMYRRFLLWLLVGCWLILKLWQNLTPHNPHDVLLFIFLWIYKLYCMTDSSLKGLVVGFVVAPNRQLWS